MRRMLIIAAAIVTAAVLAACIAVAVVWLWAEKEIPDPAPGKARAEAQAYYDRAAAGRYIVESCAWVDDTAASDYDNYDCVVAVRCRRSVSFSVPRASVTVGPFDRNAAPNGRRRGC